MPVNDTIIKELCDKVVIERTETVAFMDGYITPSKQPTSFIETIYQNDYYAIIRYQYESTKLNNMKNDNKYVPIWEKYTLTIEEASLYFNIGDKKLRAFINENPRAGYLLHNGTKTLIKRKKFEEVIDKINVI